MGNSIVEGDLASIHAALGGNAAKFEGETVVVTGCAGFLGFYLTSYLARYADVLGLKKLICLDTFLLGEPEWLSALAEEFPGRVHLQKFDVAKDLIADVPEANTAGYIIHGASIASPTFYRKHPVTTIDANIWGLRQILDFYRGQETLKGLLFFSSSEIYGDPDRAAIPTDEEYRGSVSCHGPRACYDESKRFGETLCWVYASEYGMPLTVARPFNNYGPGMRLDDRRLPADFAKAVLEDRDLVILSDGSPTRTFCYVADAVAGYLLCLLHGRYDYFNIGIAKPEIMVRDLAAIYQKQGKDILGYSGAVEYQRSDDPAYLEDNPNRRCPVISKAQRVLGYDPKVSVEEGVNRYLQFLKEGADL